MNSKIIKLPGQTEEIDWLQDAGPIVRYLKDPTVSEIMVNGPFSIFIEKAGQLQKTQASFPNEETLLKFMNTIARFVGKEINRKFAYIDARLPDGSRVNCVVPPIALDGPVLTIRKANAKVLTVKELVHAGAFNEKLLYFLNCCVAGRLNVIVSGGTGSGKTTLLNALSSFIPADERIITIEDTPELKLQSEHIVRLEARAPGPNDPGVSVRELIVNSLRMRPDRIIVGESRGPEIWDVLVAMNTGHEGSMTSIHSNSGRDAMRRIESLIMMGGQEMSSRMVRENIGCTIDIIVQIERMPSGKRQVTEVMEIVGTKDDQLLVQQIFMFDSKAGFAKSTNKIPRFISNPKHEPIKLPENFFHPDFTITLEGF
jgi:pilus assembly protein CpaF